MMKYVRLFSDNQEALCELTDEEAGRLLKAVMIYAATGEASPLTGPERIMFKVLLAQFQRDKVMYDVKAETNRVNGKLGGRPKKTQTVSEKPTKTQEKENENENENEKELSLGSTRKRFEPPTPQQVRDYAEARGQAINAERFCDFYASKGWRVGNQSMKDWKAAVRLWDQRRENLAASGLSRAAPGAAGGSAYGLPDAIL